jgi:cytochrome oxidase assembly protein ShyY1
LRAERPDLSNGPHFFYGLQWWFFAALAVFGFGYLAWDERKKLRGEAAEPEAPAEQPEQTRT